MQKLIFDTTMLELQEKLKSAEELAEARRLALVEMANTSLKVTRYARALEDIIRAFNGASFFQKLIFILKGRTL